MFLSLVLTFPLEWDESPSVVETCLDLSRWGKFICYFLSCLGEKSAGAGGVVLVLCPGVILKFFNRSPITLKFKAEKLERESQARKRERERARARARARVVVFMFLSCCCIVVSL